MTPKGNIRHPAWATRSKEYVWDVLADVFPRQISPTDFDGVIEINRCFFVFEGNIVGHKIETGQALCLRRAIEQWPVCTAVIVVGHHPPLDRVDAATGLTRCHYAWWDGSLRWGSPVKGPGCLWALASMFEEDARSARLDPGSWAARIAQAGRPFADAS